MAANLKRRIDRMYNKMRPRWATVEDIIRMLELEAEENRTPEENQTLEELWSLPLSPTLEASLKDQT